MPFSIAIPAIAAVGGALIASDGAQSAADTQAQAANNATAVGDRNYQQSREDTANYRKNGNLALDRLSQELGLTGSGGTLLNKFDGSKLSSEPGYQFGLAEGQKAITNSLAAKGGLNSGAAMKAADRFATDYAGTKFNEAFNRDNTEKLRIGNQLAGVAGTGQTATAQVNSAGATNATNAGNNAIGAGNAQAAAQLATTSAYGNALNQVGGAVKNAFGAPVTGGQDNYLYTPAASHAQNLGYAPDAIYGE